MPKITKKKAYNYQKKTLSTLSDPLPLCLSTFFEINNINIKDFFINPRRPSPPQWFRLVPLTRFGPILRKKSSGGRNFFLVRATAETKIVLKHKLPNTDYRRCTRWPIQLELHKKSIFQNLIWKNLKKIWFQIFFSKLYTLHSIVLPISV